MNEWKQGELEEVIVAKAKVAPIDKVAEIIERYSRAMHKEVEEGKTFFFQPYSHCDDLEKAVLNRNDDYLNLLLASCATEESVATSLWDWAETKDYDFGAAIRSALLQGLSVKSLITESSRGNRGELGRVSLLKSLTWEEESEGEDRKTNYAYLILVNPLIKDLIEDLLMRKGDFVNLTEDQHIFVVNCLARNPSLNFDNSDSESPDLQHWGIEKGLFHLYSNAPTDKKWFYALDSLLSNLQPETISLYDFPMEEFIDRWSKFKLMSDYEKDEQGDLIEEQGFYTRLTAVQEFLYTFAAKFGDSKFRGSKDLSVKQILESPESPQRSCSIARQNFSLKQIEELLDNYDSSNYSVEYWLLFNTRAVCSPEKRTLLRESIGEDNCREGLMNRRIQFLKGLYPNDFLGELKGISNVSSNVGEKAIENQLELKGSLEALSGKITQVSSRLTVMEKSDKTSFWVIVGLLLIIGYKLS
jgi:hypothetical protein